MEPAAQVAALLDKAELHQTPCGNGELRWQQWSSGRAGPPLILLHGGYGSWTHWIANIPDLAASRNLWTVDLPGLGDSADMRKPHATSNSAKILLRGIDSLLGAGSEFDLAGFSFGAMVAAQLAIQAGSRCRRLLLCGAAGFGHLHVQVDLEKPPRVGKDAEEARGIHASNLRSLMFANTETIDELAIYVHGENLSRARINSRPLSRTDELLKSLPQIKCALTCVWGSRDATAGGTENIAQRRKLIEQAQPNVDFHVLNGVGHWAMYESPAAFNALLTD
ncbi:alpha/beta hydrolase [Halieaceae bacterium IMCC14734]|uniref:Alpha/beta hydrolase n=1 Tax=Candidatus Litorirhabdus singularis TaxID=2518993 RepID=A0ABT3TDC5_9GAMM|nr:alpha/beta hydrolase [Candidatus Litorirhabdus singularis]MCX2980303.1 alpha/beta hydrolase [Candidatus Litorirhabdus singularis]